MAERPNPLARLGGGGKAGARANPLAALGKGGSRRGGKKDEEPDDNKSFFGQVKEAIAKTPSALIGLGQDVAKEWSRSSGTIGAAVSPVGSEKGLGNQVLGGLLGGPIWGTGVMAARGAPHAIEGGKAGLKGDAEGVLAATEASPIYGGTVASLGSTAGRVANPSRYKKASDEGALFGAIVEDVANASLVAGGVSRGVGAISKGATTEALAARNAAQAASKAASTAEKVAAAERQSAGLLPTAQNAARVAQADAAARAARQGATEAARVSAEAASKAGPLMRVARVADAVEHLGNQGAMAPMKPWIWSGQGAKRVLFGNAEGLIAKAGTRVGGKTVGVTIAKDVPSLLSSAVGKPLAEKVGAMGQRLATISAVRSIIESGRTRNTGLTGEVRVVAEQERAIRQMAEAVGGDENAIAAAIVDMEGIPQVLGQTEEALRRAGQAELADAVREALLDDAELGLTPEAYQLAVDLASGELDRVNPELAAQIRAAQDVYRNSSLEPMTQSYRTGWGAREPLSDQALADREWNVTGTGPRASAIERIERAFERAERSIIDEIEGTDNAPGLRAKAEKATGRRILPENMTPREAVAHDLAEATRIARAGVEGEPAAMREYLGLGEDVPIETLISTFADRLLEVRRTRGGSDPVLRAAWQAGEWVAPEIKIAGSGALAPTERAAQAQGQVAAGEATQGRLGARSGRADARADRANAQVEQARANIRPETLNATRTAARRVEAARARLAELKGKALGRLEKVAGTEIRQARKQVRDEVVAFRRAKRQEMLETATAMDEQVFGGEGKPYYVPQKVWDPARQGNVTPAMRDHAAALEAELGRNFFRSAKSNTAGIGLDEWMQGAVDRIRGEGAGAQMTPAEMVDVIVDHVTAARNMRRQAKGLMSRGVDDVGRIASDEFEAAMLEGSLDDAVNNFEREIGREQGGGAPPAAADTAIDRATAALEADQAAERNGATAPRGRLGELADEAARAEAAREAATPPAAANEALLRGHADQRPPVTLYRGEVGGRGNRSGGYYWSREPTYTQGFGEQFQVDVPPSVADEALRAAEAEGGMASGTHVLPPEWIDVSYAARKNTPGAAGPAVAGRSPRLTRDGLNVAERAVYDALREEGRLGGAEAASRQVDRNTLRRVHDRAAGVGRTAGRAEGQAAAFGAMLDEAFGTTERARGRAAAAPEARARSTARLTGAGVAEGVRAGKREAAAQAALRELGIKERQLARLPEKRARVVAEAAAKIKNAPARYRPVVIMARKAVRAANEMAADAEKYGPETQALVADILADIPVTLAAAVDEGIAPDFVIGGKLKEPVGKQLPRNSEVLPRTGRTGEETVRGTAMGPRSSAELKDLVTRRVRQQVQNETAREVQAAVGARADTLLGQTEEQLAEQGAVPNEAGVLEGYREVAQENPDAPAVYLPHSVANGGRGLAQAMDEAGYVAWDPASMLEKVPHDKVTTRTVFIPKVAFDNFRRYYGPGGRAEMLARTWIDQPMRAWKASILALSPRWHVGNIIGNATMAMVGTGMDPVTYARRIREAYDLMKRDRDSPTELIDPTLTKRGLTAEDWMKSEEAGRTNPVSRLVRKSYEFNGIVDDVNRVAIWLEQMDKLTPTDILHFKSRHPEFANLPDSQIKNEAAIRLSLDVAGDFTRLTPLERSVFRRVIPFYPWLRHITKLTLRLPVYAPTRVAWLLHLSDMYGDDAPLPFLEGSIPLGGENFLRLPNVNPFTGGVLPGGEGDGSGPLGLTGAVSPVISLPTLAAFGFDVRTMNQVRRAPGTGRLDKYGRPMWGPLSPDQIAYQVQNLSPQLRALRGVQETVRDGGVVMRYPTGQAVRVDGEDQYAVGGPGAPTVLGLSGRQQSLLQTGGQLLGTPYPQHVDVADIQARAAEREAQNAASRDRYEGGSGSGKKSKGGGKKNPLSRLGK